MRNSKLASRQPSSFCFFAGLATVGPEKASRFGGNSKSGWRKLKVGSTVGLLPGESGRKVCRFVSPGRCRVLESASANDGGKFNLRGIPQLTMGSTGRGVTSGPAKPGWFRGRAG